MIWIPVSKIPRGCIIAFSDEDSFKDFIEEHLGIIVISKKEDIYGFLNATYKEPLYKNCAFRVENGEYHNSGLFHGGVYEDLNRWPNLKRCIYYRGIKIV